MKIIPFLVFLMLSLCIAQAYSAERDTRNITSLIREEFKRFIAGAGAAELLQAHNRRLLIENERLRRDNRLLHIALQVQLEINRQRQSRDVHLSMPALQEVRQHVQTARRQR
jgi:hypothetical protein